MKPRFPVRVYLGKYESMLLTLYRRGTYHINVMQLERFFNFFPSDISLEAFTIFDVAEYLNWRKEKGAAPGYIALQLRILSDFWRHLIECEELPLTNPFKAIIQKHTYRKTKSLTLTGMRQLLSNCDDELLKLWMLQTAVGRKLNIGYSPTILKRKFTEVVSRTDMSKWLTYGRFIKASRTGMWRNVFRLEYNQLRNSFIDEAKFASSLAGHIQIPPLDVWATVGDCDEYASMVTGIHDSENGPKPKTAASTSKLTITKDSARSSSATIEVSTIPASY